MSRHGPDPALLLMGAVVGTARRLVVDCDLITGAIVRVREVAGQRDALLTEAAGVTAGSWTISPGHPTDLLAAGLLAASVEGLDLLVLQHWIEVGRQRGGFSARYRA